MSIRRALSRLLHGPQRPTLTTTPEAPPAADNARGHDDESLRICQAIGTRRTARRRNTR